MEPMHVAMREAQVKSSTRSTACALGVRTSITAIHTFAYFGSELCICSGSYSLTSPSPCPLSHWGEDTGEGGDTRGNRSITYATLNSK